MRDLSDEQMRLLGYQQGLLDAHNDLLYHFSSLGLFEGARVLANRVGESITLRSREATQKGKEIDAAMRRQG